MYGSYQLPASTFWARSCYILAVHRNLTRIQYSLTGIPLNKFDKHQKIIWSSLVPSVPYFSPPLEPHPKCLSKTHIILGEGIRQVSKCLLTWRWYAHYPTRYTSSLQSSPSVISFIRDWKKSIHQLPEAPSEAIYKIKCSHMRGCNEGQGHSNVPAQIPQPLWAQSGDRSHGTSTWQLLPLEGQSSFYYRIKEVRSISTNKSLKWQQFHQKFLPCSPTSSLPFLTFCQGATCYLVCLLIACYLLLLFHLHQGKG